MVISPLHGLALCAGVGGLELGLHIAEPNYRTVCYVEQNSHAAATLVARMADKALDKAPVWSDLKAFDCTPWIGKVSLVSAGYPCQPFSSTGKRRGTEDPRHLWPYIAEILRELKPEWVFLENVQGHLDIGFDIVKRELQEMGFDVEADLFTAIEAGAWHERKRLFVVAHAHRHKQPECADDRGIKRQSENDETQRLHAQPECRGRLLDTVMGSHQLLDDRQAETPLFAPAAGDLEAWADLLRKSPGLKPALRRGDDGMAGWMERSHAIGNGVCSLAAAYAWRTLKARLAGV